MTAPIAASGRARAALVYAKLGWRVHPCHWRDSGACSCGDPECTSAGKHPLLKDWPDRATTGPTLIERWWGRTPDANIAVATGSGSGIFVLDVDGPEGERTLVELERRHGTLPDLFTMSWTGGSRGGWQAFFAYPESRTIGNSGGKLGAKIDTRGHRGLAVLPPSRTRNSYRWETDRNPIDLPPAEAPDWLIDLLDPPEAAEPEAFSPLSRTDVRADAYGWRAMESELALLVSAREGRRNDQLNRSAHALYRLVADGRLYREDVDHALNAAALATGLRDREISSTLNSAARARGLR
jgi:hypothetical protein